jgi:hypothetical protein
MRLATFVNHQNQDLAVNPQRVAYVSRDPHAPFNAWSTLIFFSADPSDRITVHERYEEVVRKLSEKG